MVNSNPETVSTDYDTASRLYFEPLSPEDVLAVCRAERPVGVIAQFGGQTPLRLARIAAGRGLHDPRAPRPTRSTSPRTAGSSRAILDELGDPRAPARRGPHHGGGARRWPHQIGYPVVVRPSYVLGGRAMEIVYDEADLEQFVRDGGRGVARSPRADRPLPRRRHRGRRGRGVRRRGRCASSAGSWSTSRRPVCTPATPRARSRPPRSATRSWTPSRTSRAAGAGGSAWSGCSTCSSPSRTSASGSWRPTRAPRARCPFVSKVIGVSLARVATLVLAGRHACRPGRRRRPAGGPAPLPAPAVHRVKAAVLPFGRFPGVDTVLGPEMKSTGEVMGIDADSGMALAKAMVAAGPRAADASGTVFVSVANRDKRAIVFPATRLADMGFRLLATAGTAGVLQRAGIPVERVAKVSEGPRQRRRADPRWEGRPGRQHAVRSRRAHGRLLHPHGVGRARACRASPRCRGCSPRCEGSRRCAASRRSRARSRSITPRRCDEPLQVRLTLRRRGGRGRRGGEAPVKRVRAEILSTREAGCVPLPDARGARDRRAGTPGSVPGRADARGAGVPAAPSFLRSIRRHAAEGGPARSSSWSTLRGRAASGWPRRRRTSSWR